MHPDMFATGIYEVWYPRIRNLAQRIANGDLDFMEDLIQEALWKLSELQTSELRNRPAGYIWRILKNHMVSVYRQEQRARVIRPRRSNRGKTRRTGKTPGRIASQRQQGHFDEGPQHERAAPVEYDDDDDMWDVR